jgi:hypothetical protein
MRVANAERVSWPAGSAADLGPHARVSVFRSSTSAAREVFDAEGDEVPGPPKKVYP